ncbi:hypothetical protein V8C35DRAFT_333790 [Trichoderma chlorosporum]
MMPGSRLPKVYGPRAPEYPEDIPMALTGLMHIRYYGLEDYSPPIIRQTQGRPDPGNRVVEVTYPDWIEKDTLIKPIRPLTEMEAANVTPATLLPYWQLSSALTTPDQEEAVAQPDYEKYENMMLHWETFMVTDPKPLMHLSWKKGLEEAKGLNVNERSVGSLRGLVRRAIRDTEEDLLSLRIPVHATSRWLPVLEDDVSLILPLALGRLMGLGPPKNYNDEDEKEENAKHPGRLWDEHFVPLAEQESIAKNVSSYGTRLLATIGAANMNDEDSMGIMRLHGIVWIRRIEAEVMTAEYREWVQQWQEMFPEVAKWDIPSDETIMAAAASLQP